MGKVKVVSKNNQVSVKVKSTKDEQLNQNMAELLSNTAVEGFLPFHIVSDNNGFTAEYGIAGYETAKEFFKNRVIDQHTFSVFMRSSVNALAGISAYNMEYGNVMVSLDTVLMNLLRERLYICIIQLQVTIMVNFIMFFLMRYSE